MARAFLWAHRFAYQGPRIAEPNWLPNEWFGWFEITPTHAERLAESMAQHPSRWRENRIVIIDTPRKKLSHGI